MHIPILISADKVRKASFNHGTASTHKAVTISKKVKQHVKKIHDLHIWKTQSWNKILSCKEAILKTYLIKIQLYLKENLLN